MLSVHSMDASENGERIAESGIVVSSECIRWMPFLQTDARHPLWGVLHSEMNRGNSGCPPLIPTVPVGGAGEAASVTRSFVHAPSSHVSR